MEIVKSLALSEENQNSILKDSLDEIMSWEHIMIPSRIRIIESLFV